MKPAWVERPSPERLIFIFRAVGCAYARQPGGGCTMCGFQKVTTQGVPVSPEDLLAQFDSVFGDPRALDGVTHVDLYNSGSFLADVEIPPQVRQQVLSRLGASAVRRVLIEARPEYVRAENLAAARAALGDKELEVGIGLESADDHVRDVLVRKGFSRADFERAVGMLAGAKARLLTYLVIKPPGLGEAEAVEDAVASVRYVFEVAHRHGVPARAALQPVFVATGTDLKREYLAGRYRPPSLWSVVQVVRRAHAFGELIVGLSDEGLEPHLVPSGCPKCTGKLRQALAQYNRTRELSALEGLDCECRR